MVVVVDVVVVVVVVIIVIVIVVLVIVLIAIVAILLINVSVTLINSGTIIVVAACRYRCHIILEVASAILILCHCSRSDNATSRAVAVVE